MGLLFCYSVFGRKAKMGKSVADLGTKNAVRGVRKVDPESRAVAAQELALLRHMDEHKMVDDILKGGAKPQDYAIECRLADLFLKEQAGSEGDAASPEKRDVPEFVVDVERLSLYQDSQKPSYPDRAKSCFETPKWSSCSQGTVHGEVSLSVGEGTVSSNGHRAIPPQDGAFSGGSLGAHDDASTECSFGERSNTSSHAQGLQDGDCSGCAHLPHKFAYGAQYCDERVTQAGMHPKFEDAVEGEGCLDSIHLVCEDEERYSGHASDPGVYSRDVLKMSPSARLDGSVSPPMGEEKCASVAQKLSGESGHEIVDSTPQAAHLNEGFASHERDSTLSRVKEWIDSIHSPDMDYGFEDDLDGSGGGSSEIAHIESCEPLVALQPADFVSANSTVANSANPAVRSLHPSSTLAHLSGLSLREVPSLGIFSSLRSLNLSANLIVHVPVGCLPRSLHTLDLSRNRIAQIEGFRELTRLRVLNLSYNRISRIGHGLANCTLIKELYLAGNKIAEVEGLHRLLKLAVLDLSYNKVTTSKALGQLAANYGSLLALNLLGNPILTNFSEDQIRKLVTALTPHVAYLNRQPIKAISVREAALDNVARAALGTSQRHSKSRDVKTGRKASAVSMSTVKKKPPPHHHARHTDKKVASGSSSGHHYHGKASEKAHGVGHMSFLGVSQQGSHNITFASGKRPMPRSRSEGVLHE